MNKKAKTGMIETKAKHKYHSDKKPDEELKGVGGWLIFFIIGLIISVFVLGYDVLISYELIAEMPILTLFLLLETFVVVMFIISLVHLFNRDKRGVEILKWALWLPMLTFILMAIMWWLLAIEVTIDIFTAIFQGGIYAWIWTSYFKKSVRVKNTYYGGKIKLKKEKDIDKPLDSSNWVVLILLILVGFIFWLLWILAILQIIYMVRKYNRFKKKK